MSCMYPKWLTACPTTCQAVPTPSGRVQRAYRAHAHGSAGRRRPSLSQGPRQDVRMAPALRRRYRGCDLRRGGGWPRQTSYGSLSDRAGVHLVDLRGGSGGGGAVRVPDRSVYVREAAVVKVTEGRSAPGSARSDTSAGTPSLRERIQPARDDHSLSPSRPEGFLMTGLRWWVHRMGQQRVVSVLVAIPFRDTSARGRAGRGKLVPCPAHRFPRDSPAATGPAFGGRVPADRGLAIRPPVQGPALRADHRGRARRRPDRSGAPELDPLRTHRRRPTK